MVEIVYRTIKKREYQKSFNQPKDGAQRILEKTTRANIEKVLKKHNVFYFAPVNFGYGKAGIPDVIACVNGRFVGIEAKGWQTGHILTKDQQKVLDEIKENGGISFVANPFNIDELDKIIEGLKK